MTSGPPREVSGSVLVGAELDSFENASLRVFLEDVTLQDVSAEVIDQEVVPGISHKSGTENRHPFRLTVPGLDERASYAVRAHVDRRGDGEIRVGDYITMQSYPVLTFGHPTHLTLRVRQVK